MTYTEFQNAWIGKRVDYDGVYAYQCVDLIKQYLKQVYGLSPGAWGNAIDYWTNTNGNILTKFDKVTGSAAKQGDIVILNGYSGNPYGHIGIATGAIDGTNVEILEQNGSTGNGSGLAGDAIRKRFVARSRVAGLLRPKGSDMITQNDRSLIERLSTRLKLWNPGFDMNKEMNAWQGQDFRKFLTEGMNEADAEFKRREEAASKVNQLSGQITGLTQTVNEKQAEINTLVDENAQLKAKLAQAGSDSVQLTALGTLLNWLIVRLGLRKG